MAVRAFIIAIEDYKGFLPSLPNTNDAAAQFRSWLIGKKGVSANEIRACIDSNLEWSTAGTTSDAILKELRALRNASANSTDELYFFFSGHGFSSAVSPDKSVNVLVASDFEGDDSGRACLSLDEIKEKLYKSLGPGNHYYFIDACRNLVSEIQFTNTGLNTKPSPLGTPTVYRLFSTAEGDVAKTKSGFAQALVQGLNGDGIAKDWRGNRMWVIFDRLCDFIKEKIAGQDIVATREGTADGRILEIAPIPEYDCKVNVINASANDTFQIEISTVLSKVVSETFTGSQYPVKLKPYNYYVRVSHPNEEVVQVNPPPSDDPLQLFDTSEIDFKKTSGLHGGGSPPLPAGSPVPGDLANLMVVAGPQTELHLENLDTGETLVGGGGLHNLIKPGAYLLRMKEFGVTLEKRSLELKPGQRLELDLLERPKSRIREEILGTLPQGANPRLAEFSERLGPIANWDLGLWLSLLGASRIVAAPGEYHKLADLPLADFVDIAPGSSAVYVLAAFERTEGTFRVALSQNMDVAWSELASVKELSSIYQYRLNIPPGPFLLSIKIPEQPPLTYASYSLPNRATFVVLTEDGIGHINLHQYLLPIRNLFGFLDPNVLERLNDNPLAAVRTMFLAQQQFATKRPVDGPVEQFSDLIYGKWLDPIMSLIGAYELLRRGYLEKRNLLEIMVDNLRRYFAGLPDIEAIAKMIGRNDWKTPSAAPLLLDGVLAFDDDQEQQILPLPPNKLDYGSVWTMWPGVVNDPDQTAKRELERTT